MDSRHSVTSSYRPPAKVAKVSRKVARDYFYYSNSYQNGVKNKRTKEFANHFFSAMTNHVYFKSFAYKAFDNLRLSNKVNEFGLTLNGKLLKGTRFVCDETACSVLEGVFDASGQLQIGSKNHIEIINEYKVISCGQGEFYSTGGSLKEGSVELQIINTKNNFREKIFRIGKFNSAGKQISGQKVSKNKTYTIKR